MISLTEKYQPKRIDGFAGLTMAKTIMAKLAANPWQSSWLFVGDSGTGKTTLALALADEIGAELHHIPSASCNLETVQRVCESCYYAPMFGGGSFHLVLVDEADTMSLAAQNAFLSRLDATNFPPNTIFIFTCNGVKKLEPRFQSRCRVIFFDGQAESQDSLAFLSHVWQSEAAHAPAPDFAAILESHSGNIRACLMALELDILMAPSAPVQIRSDFAIAARVLADTIRSAGIEYEAATLLTDAEWLTVASVAKLAIHPSDEVIELALAALDASMEVAA